MAPALSEAVRSRVVAYAADCLGSLAAVDVPLSLRRLARFTPSKRARLAAAALAAAVDADPVFRNQVAQTLRAALPEFVAAIEAGQPPPAADPADVAAAAYLLRPPGWPALVAAAAAEGERLAAVPASSVEAEATRQSRRLDDALASARDDRDKYRAAAASAADKLDEVRRSLRHATEAARTAELARELAVAERAAAAAAAEKAATKSSTETRRLKARITELEMHLEHARRASKDARGSDDVRLWLLLDSLTNAATGLRRELALPPASVRPADEVAARLAAPSPAPAPAPAGLGLAREDPAWLDALIAVPGTHLLVDGYNVTKTGFPDVPLEAQRNRLTQGLAAIAARTGTEITAVFDGAERQGGVAASSARGVRVLFSPAGRTADDVLVELVRAEPAGRPIVVVSADREVVTRVEVSGARGVPPVALLGLLARK